MRVPTWPPRYNDPIKAESRLQRASLEVLKTAARVLRGKIYTASLAGDRI
jgi:hypothetical protein